jgi:hypothetical protein
MRTSLLSIALAPALFVAAQQPAPQPVQPPAGSNWQHVQALPLGASIYVKARHSHSKCILKSVDADTLTCIHAQDVVFQRSDIVNIKIPRRGRSTLVGLAIGAGVGAALGAAAGGDPCKSGSGFCVDPVSRGGAAAMTSALVGGIGAPIGYFTDFTRSTVYKAP